MAIENDKIIGYAYAGAYRERAAYDWVVELSIYLDENERQHGAGSALYQKLLTALSVLNYQRAYACITYPNPASVAFHKKFGFEQIGLFPKAGYKFEQWYGIVWLERSLQTTDKVTAIKLLTDLSENELEKKSWLISQDFFYYFIEKVKHFVFGKKNIKIKLNKLKVERKKKNEQIYLVHFYPRPDFCRTIDSYWF